MRGLHHVGNSIVDLMPMSLRGQSNAVANGPVGGGCMGPVSYIHLDVYKRQVLLLIKISRATVMPPSTVCTMR